MRTDQMPHAAATSAAQATPLVSVGIPTYSRPEDLRTTLAQITGQSYRNLEIIVSDNATDGGAVDEVVGSFAASDKRIRYFRQPSNLGATANFQFVLEQATGEYFMWCADDDWHHPDFVARLLAELTKDPDAAIAFCDITGIDPTGKRLPLYEGFHERIGKLACGSRLLRQWRFFVEPEWKGKPCLMYGLLRRQPLAGFSWPAFVSRHGFAYSDNLFTFTLLEGGHVAAVAEKLFGIQVGNQKHNVSGHSGLLSPLWKLREWLRYVAQYQRLARGPERLLYALAMPWKLVQILLVTARRRLAWAAGRAEVGRSTAA